MANLEQEFKGSPLATLELIENRPDIMDRIGDGALILYGASISKCTADPEVFASFQGATKEAPRFLEQLNDSNRKNPVHFNRRIIYDKTTRLSYSQRGLTSEAEAMAELRDVLLDLPKGKMKLQELLEQITFIGQKEYEEAVLGIANQWKRWLSEDKDRQICPLVGIIERKSKKTVKSDEYMLERILNYFSDEELRKFSGRLVLRVEDLCLERGPEKRQILLIDDWCISGSQMEVAYQKVKRELGKLAEEVIVQLIAAGKDFIDKGLGCHSRCLFGEGPAVRAYYEAHEVPESTSVYRAVITGSHSSVDYGFADEFLCGGGVYIGEVRTVPKLVSVIRPYRLPGVSRGALVRTGTLRRYNQELVD